MVLSLPGAKVPPMELSLPWAKCPGGETSRERIVQGRNVQGANRPGGETSTIGGETSGM